MKTRLMFDFAKTILENVSFDPKLFYKELHKAINQLLPYDVEQLGEWVNGFVKGKPELQESLNLINA
ncbi:hypothetical protein HX017_13065 [Myroides marinus]|jgi:hypothetical protein|uniref:Uncharacterized protein n=1 Tax=Myroides marinus TaxID=703342 RepID=A0A165QZ34_9FLAO|nr:hypothetical protein [Myroides marinus]MDR0196003.1 hypothetical protein [Myroides sp.]KUF44510.1 hypothetical protein AS361_15780 [Myroides marinus]KZE77362.1 hypothetical protein AV926_01125 [Myroides marinus]MDM1347024.1 hypothetical protein [Myroides marinus]MDM1351565.1 hypothetical protein [Myroides marinus]